MDLTTLRRSPAATSKVAGVCDALAVAWRVDPLIIRAVFVVLGLSGGVGLVLYAALWLTLPAADGDRAVLDSALPGWRGWPQPLKIGALVATCLLSAALLSTVLPFGVTPAIVVLAVWYFGLYRPRRAAEERRENKAALTGQISAPFAADTEFTRQAAAWQQRVHEHLRHQQTTQPDPRAWPTRPGPAAPMGPATEQPGERPSEGVDLRSGATAHSPAYTHHPGYSMDAFLASVPDPGGIYSQPAPTGATVVERRPRRRRNASLSWTGLALTGLAMAGVALAGMRYDVPFAAYPAAGLLVVGLVLIAGTWLGRPRGMIALGVVLAVLSAGAFGAPAPHGSSNREYAVTVTTPDALPGRISRDVGSVDVDLSQLQLTENRKLRVAVDAGQIHVRVPENMPVRVTYQVDAGSAKVLDAGHFSGFDGKDTVVVPGTGPVLELDLSVEMGEIEVTR
ncbi:hypothetical protein GCM10027418_24890 [Mariniluteicoccus endophyticus]